MAKGIMFHHFCDAVHPRGQGAISSAELEAMIEFLGPENILDPYEFAARSAQGTLAPSHLCLTFDDALLCQYDVALPVLDKFGLKAFWFIYSSVFTGGLEPLEIYRYFRTVAYRDIDTFYAEFFREANCDEALATFVPSTYLRNDPFYTDNDRRFRYLRDDFLGEERYRNVMDKIIANSGMSIEGMKNILWMTNHHLQQLTALGHVVGLHSFRHPTRLASLPVSEQKLEYTKNAEHLRSVIGYAPWAVSHPCNSYSDDTLKILQSLGVTFGFRAYEDAGPSQLEMPREDHALVLRRMAA
jgi:peptidoglycan/xylan/chitin deacetylase (PgdA/CDA1 family)